MITKREMFDWLATTVGPRRLQIGFGFPEAASYEVGCEVARMRRCKRGCAWCNPDRRERHGKTLATVRTFARAQQVRAKYRRWLDEFKAAEGK